MQVLQRSMDVVASVQCSSCCLYSSLAKCVMACLIVHGLDLLRHSCLLSCSSTCQSGTHPLSLAFQVAIHVTLPPCGPL